MCDSCVQTDKEYRDRYLTYARTNWEGANKVKVYDPPAVSSLPDAIDWRARGAVSKVKYQVPASG